ncbi:MAG TPA: 3-dehydroquinate synthase [Candidatus Izemoplasmatales bacterium]|nr:3-dehydroquinate synthase [Candidatus Izemoplasmatales bacterium]
METINIKTRSSSYPVYIGNGLLESIKDILDTNRPSVIISDDGIPKQYIDLVSDQYDKCLKISFPQGEKSKSLRQYERLVGFLSSNHVSRDWTIVAVGGGVTGDLAGFVASTYLRGIDLVHIPTTLLAQIDSSVGGKVAVNTDRAKNVIGSFYPPKAVIIDPLTLSTLPQRQFANGIGEMVKYGMIADKQLFDLLREPIYPESIEPLVVRSVNIKKHFVESDEFDKGIRQALNFGHTFGHAIEAYYNYEKYLHGEAVSIGMMRILSDPIIKNELESVLKTHNLPIGDPVPNEQLWEYVRRDKKILGARLTYVTVENIGSYVLKSAQSKEDLS